jgi:hypothetical protein
MGKTGDELVVMSGHFFRGGLSHNHKRPDKGKVWGYLAPEMGQG